MKRPSTLEFVLAGLLGIALIELYGYVFPSGPFGGRYVFLALGALVTVLLYFMIRRFLIKRRNTQD